MHIHNRGREKSSGQATHPVQYLNNMSHGQNLSSTSGEPELLHSNSLKFQPLFKKRKENVLVVVKLKKNTTTTKTLFCWIVMFTVALLWLLETSKSKIAGPPKKTAKFKAFDPWRN
jgi:hypothetical protein